jgi:hypothetical protein
MGSTAGESSTLAMNATAAGDSLALVIKSARLPPLFALLKQQIVTHVTGSGSEEQTQRETYSSSETTSSRPWCRSISSSIKDFFVASHFFNNISRTRPTEYLQNNQRTLPRFIAEIGF